MSQIKHLKGYCGHCGGKMEFPADALGMTVECPHCNQQTELTLPPPPDTSSSSIPAKAIVWAIVAVLILGGGLIGAIIALKKAERLYGRQKQSIATSQRSTNGAVAELDPATKAGFQISQITIEKKPDSTLIYATGALANLADRRRFGVKIQFDLLDAANQKIGVASDYQQIIEPKGDWKFKALIVDPKTISVRLASITEEK